MPGWNFRRLLSMPTAARTCGHTRHHSGLAGFTSHLPSGSACTTLHPDPAPDGHRRRSLRAKAATCGCAHNWAPRRAPGCGSCRPRRGFQSSSPTAARRTQSSPPPLTACPASAAPAACASPAAAADEHIQVPDADAVSGALITVVNTGKDDQPEALNDGSAVGSAAAVAQPRGAI